MTDFIIEHQCPQCGAPAELKETDRLFRCGFCRVASYLHVAGVFRYILPSRAPADKTVIYFPYWRFKGMFFSCYPGGMDKRWADFSRQAIATHLFPVNVGFRSQTQKLQFAGTRPGGVFLKPQLSSADIIAGLDERFGANLPKPILHQAHIGETLSLIFAPFYLDDKLMDAMLNEPVGSAAADEVTPLLSREHLPAWPITFIPTLCPQCGWDMEGASDALTLTCANCRSAWWAKRGKLEPLPSAYMRGGKEADLYLPFWRIRADIGGMRLESYADLIRIANLPKVVQPGWERQPFYFWTPAFKVRPQRFISFGAHVTASQPGDEMLAGYPDGPVHGVNLPIREAVESLKLILTTFVRPRKRVEQVLQTMQIRARRFRLIYLPFREGHHELVHKGMSLAINKNLLVHARRM